MMDGDDWNPATTMLPQHERHHEHGSDDESSSLDENDDDEERAMMLLARRDRTHSDNDGSGDNLHFRSRGGRSAFQSNSSDHESDGSVYRHGLQELHHRHPAALVRTHSGEFVGTPPRAGANVGPGTNGKSRAQHGKWRAPAVRRHAWTVWLRLSIGSGVMGYFVLVILGSQILHKTDPNVTDFPFLHLQNGHAHQYRGTTHIKREHLEKERFELKQETTRAISERANARQQRIRPPALSESIAMIPRRTPSLSTPASQETSNTASQTPASLEELCGIHAGNASLVYPHSYLSRDALNARSSRVLITGILNPIGFHLALTLKQRCGIDVMFGMDPMFPNTIKHRMSLLTRMRLLISNIPKLAQPIVLPLIGLDPRLNKSKKSQPTLLQTTGELNLLNFNPTHIVHLASYSPEEYMNLREPEYSNYQSPYVTENRQAPMFRLRSSLVAMEQILSSVSSVNDDEDHTRPHVTFASAVSSHSDPVHRFTKTADELLADTYHMLHGTYSVGVRLPEVVYGPWGRPGADLYDLAQTAIGRWSENHTAGIGRQLLDDAGLTNRTDLIREMVYVDDAVNAIIASMQYRSEGSRPVVLEMSSPSKHGLSSVASAVESFLPHSQATLFSGADSVVGPSPDSFAHKTSEALGWTPTTSLKDGLTKTLAWHLDEQLPHGDPDKQMETGDGFLSRNAMAACASDDFVCNAGRTVLPCASECANKEQCGSSVFDSVSELIEEVTRDCDIVLYTQSLGYNVRDLSLSSKYMEEGKQIICNFAFVPRESELVGAVIRKVPNNQLKKFGISTGGASPSVMKQHRLDGLNGRLLYKGWILLWVPETTVPLPTADKFLLKLSPGKLFSSVPKYALYIDEKFPVSPNIDDVLFLVGETHRPPFKGRSVYRRDKHGEKHKYKLAREPERRAIVLVAPLKRRSEKDTKNDEGLDGTKLSVYEATKYMRFEIGENANTQKESSFVKKQREFYERVQTFTNRQEMRSNLEPWYRYEMKHWIRSRWIVHDLKLDDSRELRCEWYTEHVPWGTDLDQLSFAHVMARREIERRITQAEPDDHVKPAHVEEPILKELTDAHEWHPMIGHKPADFDAIVKVPQHMFDKDEAELEDAADIATDAPKHKDVPLFVRVMSERVMLITRKAWQARHGTKKGKRYKKKTK